MLKRMPIFQRIISVLLVIGLLASSFFVIQAAAADPFETALTQQGFPESYKAKLRALHKKYPNWQFQALHTKLDWNSAVTGEKGNDKNNFIQNVKSTPESYKCQCSNCYKNGVYTIREGSTWVSASKEAISHYMDPRNFLDEQNIFQFELLSYDAGNQTQAGVEGILKGTFMANKKISYINTSGKTVNTNQTYSDVIMQAAKESKTSPYYIASKIRQEIGTTATGSVSGKYTSKVDKNATYTGYYNFYNIGANTSGDTVANALSNAKNGTGYGRPWNTPMKSIIGGAQFIAAKYINVGQNTGYLQKFNVAPKNSANLYQHQYMSNVKAAAAEGVSTYNGYSRLGALSDSKVFLIPVYNNMPGAEETTDTSVSLNNIGKRTGAVKLSSGSLNVRSGPGTSYSLVQLNNKNVTLTNKAAVTILSQKNISDTGNPLWYQVQFKSGSSTVTGYISARYVTLNSSLTMGVGESYLFDVTTQPASAASSLTWSSSNTSIAAVDKQGKITAKKAGSFILTVTTKSGNSDSCLITVAGKPSSLSVSPAAASLKVGQTLQLSASVGGGSAANRSFTSSNTAVAAVDANGKITAQKTGTATITVSIYSGQKATCKVTVAPAGTPVQSVTLNGSAMTVGVGEKRQLTATVKPAHAAAVSWSSSNTSVATVSASGLVTPKKAGKAVITAAAGGKKAAFTFTVKKAPTSFTFNYSSATLKVGQTIDLNTFVNGGAASYSRTYATSNAAVATVASGGIVTAKKTGSVTITCTTYNGKQAVCKIKVEAITPSSKVTGTVNASLLNVRTGASTSYPLVKAKGKQVQLSRNTKVTIVSTSGNWYKITGTFNGTSFTGYVSGEYIKKTPANGNSSSNTGTVNASKLNVRTGTSTLKPILKINGKLVQLPRGTKVQILSTAGSWYRVTGTFKGKSFTGYVSAQYIKK